METDRRDLPGKAIRETVLMETDRRDLLEKAIKEIVIKEMEETRVVRVLLLAEANRAEVITVVIPVDIQDLPDRDPVAVTAAEGALKMLARMMMISQAMVTELRAEKLPVKEAAVSARPLISRSWIRR